jgi:acyl carrier protein
MPPDPSSLANRVLARFPAEVQEAFERFRTKGDADAVEAVVVAAVVDHRPSSAASPRLVVTDNTRLIEDLGYDSVAVAELVFFLEDLFEMTITNADILGVGTIGDLRACVIRKLAEKSGAA